MFWVPLAVGWALLFHRDGTERAAAVAGAAARVRPDRGFLVAVGTATHRHKVGQFAKAIAPPAGRPAIEARAAVHVPATTAPVKTPRSLIDVPHDFTGADGDMEDITRAVTAKLGLLAPKVTLALESRSRG